jgi:peptidoglycan biosynthesis protein MviN/MurJ (putative lipid II flippase)
VQETLARVYYARKEPYMPLYGVLLRMLLYVLIGVLGVTVLRGFGAPMIAAAELSISVEALFLLVMLNRRIERKVWVLPAIGKGLLAAALSGAVTYALALFLPGPGYVTAMIGLAVGTFLAVVMVWSEARLLFKL